MGRGKVVSNRTGYEVYGIDNITFLVPCLTLKINLACCHFDCRI
jgi:hypothetical protein